jgi:hypothetical protein
VGSALLCRLIGIVTFGGGDRGGDRRSCLMWIEQTHGDSLRCLRKIVAGAASSGPGGQIGLRTAAHPRAVCRLTRWAGKGIGYSESMVLVKRWPPQVPLSEEHRSATRTGAVTWSAATRRTLRRSSGGCITPFREAARPFGSDITELPYGAVKGSTRRMSLHCQVRVPTLARKIAPLALRA